MRRKLQANLLSDFSTPLCLGRYELGVMLGEGGMGVVYEGYDTVLRRSVALKVLRKGVGEPKRLTEASALAALTHPNVVQVFDVGVERGRPWMAMERIEGQTLGVWAAGEATWKRRVEAVLDVAEGLNAVHRVGLLHRDVKPANVMVDRDGRVRLMDFGLAREHVESTRSVDPLAGAVTNPAGTPGFIAPEILAGSRPTERSDQYSFAVTALAVLADAPARVRQVLERGRAVDAGSRWPRMDELTRALERSARTRRRGRWIVPVAAVAALAGAVAVSTAGTAPPSPCVRRQTVLSAWSEASVAHERLLQGPPAQRFQALVDEAAEVALKSCERAKRGRWSPPMLAWTDRCLADERARLQAVASAYEADDPALREASRTELMRRSPVADCVARSPSAMSEPVFASEVSLLEVHRDLLDVERALVFRDAAGAEAAMDALWRRVVALEWPPLGRQVRLRRVLVRLERRDVDGAIEDAEGVYYEALAARDWSRAAASASAMTLLVGDRRGNFVGAQGWAEHARAAAARAGTPDPIENAELDRRESRNAVATGDMERGARLLEGSLQQLDEALGAGSVRAAVIRVEYAAVLREADRADDALRQTERAMTDISGVLGPDHPVVTGPLNTLASLHGRAGDMDAARAALERAVAIRLSHPSDDVPVSMVNLGMLEAQSGNFERAESLLSEGVVEFKRVLGDEHSSVASVLTNLGVLYMQQKQHEKAEAALQEALALREKIHPANHPEIGWVLVALVDLSTSAKRHDRAPPLAKKAISILEEAYGKEHSAVGEGLLVWGANRLDAKDFRTARPVLERAASILEAQYPEGNPRVVQVRQFLAELDEASG